MSYAASDAIDLLAPALIKFQAQQGPILKTKTVDTGKYKYDYAPLDHIVEEIREPLAQCGLALVQTPSEDRLEVRVIHESGQWIGGDIGLPPNNDPKALGSDITYRRRYLMSALLNLATEEDDDGTAATEKRKGDNKEAKAKMEARGPMVTALNDYRKVVGKAPADQYFKEAVKRCGKTHPEQLTIHEMQEICSVLIERCLDAQSEDQAEDDSARLATDLISND